MIPSLTEDCGQCAALCCLALAFDKGEDFAIDKPAGTPCPHLARHACSIHARLEDEGFPGCIRYSCTGAGQRVVQEIFGGQSWQDDPALTRPMIDVFRGMREVQERLAQLSAARALSLDEADRAECDRLVTGLLPDHIGRAAVENFPGSAQQDEIDRFVKSLRRYVFKG